MGTYYRPARSGRKPDRQPRAKDFKRSTFLTVEEDDPENRPDGKLPPLSITMLSDIMSSLLSREISIDPVFRQYYVIGSWKSHDVYVTSFFTQPDVSTCMCSVRGASMSSIKKAVDLVCSEYDEYSALSYYQRGPKSAPIPALVQLSGRLAPYAYNALLEEVPGSTCSPTFCNLSRCRIGFAVCSGDSMHMRSLGKRSIEVLKSHFPTWSGCILHSSLQYYRVLCNPEPGAASEKGNNSSMLIYTDGRVRFQGAPDVLSRAAEATNHAINAVLRSKSWHSFVAALEPYDRLSHQQVGGDTASISNAVTETASATTFTSYR